MYRCDKIKTKLQNIAELSHKKLQYRIFCLFQIHDEKVEFRVGSRIGSLANVKVKPKSFLVIVKEYVILLDRIIKLAIACAWVSC